MSTAAWLWQRDGGMCHLCLRPVEGGWHLDHVIPLSRGGKHSYANCAVSHPRCNWIKMLNRPSDIARLDYERLFAS
jgi:5-methylcytosine-specific restriction endonuclease McrA